MSEESNLVPNGAENVVRDGLTTPEPLPRDGAGPVEPAGEDGDLPGGAGSAGGETGMANSAGGIMYQDDDEAPGSSSGTAAAEVAGLNAPAGPAADQESGTPDDRGLTTDISPSD
ncbi:hypothetical protein HER39_07960 [Arthrobacter deserti]|uniref:Uncharacterized protein n=1 Tax=Arthrobacter deserti TaxID=1742687 RepID=A0ABX1JMI1_9MICC|nr:hypothetical protein [Arthrobacter deserti]